MIPGLINFTLIYTAALILQAESYQTAGMADLLQSSGKIYVVVAVVTIIMTGLLLYLIRLDRKISKLEKKLNEKRPS
jgi:CcmD family protein